MSKYVMLFSMAIQSLWSMKHLSHHSRRLQEIVTTVAPLTVSSFRLWPANGTLFFSQRMNFWSSFAGNLLSWATRFCGTTAG